MSAPNLNLLFSDNFHRADGPLAAPWSLDAESDPGLQIASDICMPIPQMTSPLAVYFGTQLYNAGALPNDQFASVTLANLPISFYFVAGFIRLRITDNGGAPNTWNSYILSIEFSPGSPNGVWFLRGGVNGNSFFGIGNLTLNIGDVITLAIVGTSLFVLQNGVVVTTVTDASVDSGGSALGLEGSTEAPAVQISNWAVGGAYAALAVATSSLPNGTQNVAYSQALAATGGVGSDTWSLASGSLPTGLSLSSAGVISGTPTVLGTSTFTVRVQDANSPVDTATSQSLSITINAPGGTYDPTKPFIGSMSETSDDSLGTQYIGHVIVLASAPAGLSNPYLGKIKKVTNAPAGVGDPLLGQVVIVSDAPTGGNPYLGHVKET